MENPRARLSLIAGVLTWLFGIAGFVAEIGVLYVPAIVAALITVVTGHSARQQIRNDSSLTGSGKARAGLILGYFFWFVLFLFLMFWLVLVTLFKNARFNVN